jgi:hypothetical protein
MTEAEWCETSDLFRLLRYLLRDVAEVSGPQLRKLRLFVCACWRRPWNALEDPCVRNALDAAEAYADGAATHYRLRVAVRAARQAHHPLPMAGGSLWAASASVRWPLEPVETVARACATAAVDVLNRVDAYAAEWAAQAALLRDLFGNPFRPCTPDPAWLCWRDGLVRTMAQTIYEARRFDDMPVLGDALEEAGCADAQVLEHCRGSGAHARGCWLLDRLRGV